MYSVYDDTPHTKSRIEGVSSHEAFDKDKIEGMKLEQVRLSMNAELRNDQKLNSKEEYSGQAKDMHAPVISVTSVKIQKAKSLHTA